MSVRLNAISIIYFVIFGTILLVILFFYNSVSPCTFYPHVRVYGIVST